ncbi:hypothetical protein HRbin33_00099 [bacterium HR33]|nr:hypothetical protein HRbin33_00099 [bacterium HR33]
MATGSRSPQRPHIRFSVANAAGILLSALTLAGCIPYTVGSTAQPLRPGETQVAASWYFIPNGIELYDSSYTLSGIDVEVRRGLDNGVADVGIRVPSVSGIMLSYKRRLGARGDFHRPAVAVQAGAGFVNLGQHFAGELGIIASGRERNSATPYGGVRVVHVLPLSQGAVRDSPTAGGFFGIRLGSRDFGVSPEIGVYYDRSALGIRSTDFIVVPAITLHGSELLRILRGF